MHDLSNGRFHEYAAALPEQPGAYVLLIELTASLSVRYAGKQGQLSPGRYLYCGSAKGPGGLKARLGRHMRKDKKAHWHIDQLTLAGKVLGAWVFLDRSECALAALSKGCPAPLPGFGATDCRNGCESHLLFWPDGIGLVWQEENAKPS